jgi:hypothetical protein
MFVVDCPPPPVEPPFAPIVPPLDVSDPAHPNASTPMTHAPIRVIARIRGRRLAQVRGIDRWRAVLMRFSERATVWASPLSDGDDAGRCGADNPPIPPFAGPVPQLDALVPVPARANMLAGHASAWPVLLARGQQMTDVRRTGLLESIRMRYPAEATPRQRATSKFGSLACSPYSCAECTRPFRISRRLSFGPEVGTKTIGDSLALIVRPVAAGWITLAAAYLTARGRYQS